MPLAAAATDVTVIGLFPNMAVVTIDRGSPKTLKVGERTSEGVLLISVANGGAQLEIDGKRQTLEMGQHFETAASTSQRSSVTLSQDARGHFRADAQVNGSHVRFLVDTGATLVSIPMAGHVQSLNVSVAAGLALFEAVRQRRRK